jgi:putative flippase GtrA
MDSSSDKVTGARWAMFNAVGLLGFVVQLASLWVLQRGANLHYLSATAIAVEIAILHNFFWHQRWTWVDRRTSRSVGLRLVRFNVTNGAISLIGNVVVTAGLVETGHLDTLAANAIGVAACSLVNFVASDLLVFASVLAVVIPWTALATDVHAADLRPETVAAFERYAHATEARMDAEARGESPFLWIDTLSESARKDADAKVTRGEIVVSRLHTRPKGNTIEIPDGMGHHWVGTVALPGATLEQVISLMQSYDKYEEIYRPAVRRSKTLSHEGNHYKVFLQLFQKKIISVVLNTESDVSYVALTSKRMQVRSTSSRIAEIESADTPQEHEQPAGHDNGFLWRFNNYCAIEERDRRTFVQCESVSLSRDVPFGLGWLIGPFVSDVPRESLEFTLGMIRKILVGSRSASLVQAAPQ